MVSKIERLMINELKFKDALDEHDYVVIPSENICEMFQDEMGFVHIKVGANSKNGNMLFFLDGQNIYGKFSNFHRDDVKFGIGESDSYGK